MLRDIDKIWNKWISVFVFILYGSAFDANINKKSLWNIFLFL